MNSTQIITIKYSQRQAALANYVAVARANENSSTKNTKKKRQ